MFLISLQSSINKVLCAFSKSAKRILQSSEFDFNILYLLSFGYFDSSWRYLCLRLCMILSVCMCVCHYI